MRIQDYNPRDWKSHPPYTFIAYGSSVKRGPLKRLVPIQQTLSEITGPLFRNPDGAWDRAAVHAARLFSAWLDGDLAGP